jgi:hypothetical protein
MSQSRGLRRVVAIVIRVSGATSANGMARPCSYHRRRESDGNQHRSTVDPCQSTPDDSSVLISIPLMLTQPTGSGASLLRSGGQYGQARMPGKSCRNHNDLLEARGGADARHYRRDANTSIC